MNGKLPVFNIERFAIHDGPGIRTAVFLQGCPLRCPWCANPESQIIGEKLLFLRKKCMGCGACERVCTHGAAKLKDGHAEIDRDRCLHCGACAAACPAKALEISGRWMTPEEIFAMVDRDRDYYRQTGGGLTISGGEALLHLDALMPLLEQCRTEGISVCFETCGHVSEESIRKAMPFTTCFLYDVKTANPEKFRAMTGGDLAPVLENLRLIAETDPAKAVIRVPVIPGFNHTENDMREIFSLAMSLDIKQADLLPYHTLGRAKYAQLGLEYPYPAQQGLPADELVPYVSLGEQMGLYVTIGG